MAFERICIVGPGAIGGMMAVKMIRAGFDVSVLVRPPRVDAINTTGITLHDDGETFTATPKAASDPGGLGPQDIVIVTVKEQGLVDVAPQVRALCGPDTPVVQITNGIPWWFFHAFGGPLQGTRIEAVDRGGCVSSHFNPDTHVGGVINCGVSWQADGSLRHDHSNHLALGRPDNGQNGMDEIKAVFDRAGYNAEVSGNIQQNVMTKLLANISFNPVSALAMATLDRLMADPEARGLLHGLMNEGRAVTSALGLDPGPDPAERFGSAGNMGPSKTSMLQDMEAGKPLELNGILGAAIEVGERTGTAMPLSRAMFGLLRVRTDQLRVRTAGAGL